LLACLLLLKHKIHKSLTTTTFSESIEGFGNGNMILNFERLWGINVHYINRMLDPLARELNFESDLSWIRASVYGTLIDDERTYYLFKANEDFDFGQIDRLPNTTNIEQPNSNCEILESYQDLLVKEFPKWWDVDMIDDSNKKILICKGDWSTALIILSPKKRQIYYIDF